MINVGNVLKSFSQIRSFYANELKRRLKMEHFSPNELSILILLHNNPSIDTSSQLVLFLEVSKALVSRSLESLSKKGLVEAIQDENDRRIQHLRLTEKSLPLIEKIVREMDKINEEIFQDIDEKQVNEMCQLMNQILERFKGKELYDEDVK